MIQRVAVRVTLFLAVAFLISACASPNEVMTEKPSSQSGASVPGERTGDEDNFAPGTGGSSASVRW